MHDQSLALVWQHKLAMLETGKGYLSELFEGRQNNNEHLLGTIATLLPHLARETLY